MLHHRQLVVALAAHPGRWELLGSYPLTQRGAVAPDAIRVYRLRPAGAAP
jgi:hypothetical protein